MGNLFRKTCLTSPSGPNPAREVIEKIVDLGQDRDGLIFQVQWEGLPDKRDFTWQPAKELYADVPDLVTRFLSSFKKKKFVATVKRHLGISS